MGIPFHCLSCRYTHMPNRSSCVKLTDMLLISKSHPDHHPPAYLISAAVILYQCPARLSTPQTVRWNLPTPTTAVWENSSSGSRYAAQPGSATPRQSAHGGKSALPLYAYKAQAVKRPLPPSIANRADTGLQPVVRSVADDVARALSRPETAPGLDTI